MSSRKNFTKESINFLILIILLIVIFPGYTLGGGRTGGSFLKIGVGGRCIGMGEAGAAVSNGVNSIFWNPAGLSQISSPELSFMHNEWFQSINYEYLGYAQPLDGKDGVIGISFYSLGMDKIDGYDENDKPTEGVKASDFAWALSYARELKNWPSEKITLSGGINLKFIQEKLDDETGKASAIDMGFLCTLPLSYIYSSPTSSNTKSENPYPPTVGIGLVVQNIGSGIEFYEEKAPLPRNFKLGLSLSALDNALVTCLDYNLPYRENQRVNLGIEYTYFNMLTLRSGYVFGLDNGEGLRVGMGLKFKKFQLDYAFAPYGDLGYSHRVNLKMRFFYIIPKTSS